MSPVYASESPRNTSASAAADVTAIVGLACRVPGAMNASKLWENLAAQRDVQQKIPPERFNVDAFFHPDGSKKGTTNARFAYLLDQDISLFDAGFFNISGKEAEAMDPQQRLLLEVVYEALEDAGITMAELSGSRTSVYAGSFTKDYDVMISKDLEHYPKYTVTGTGGSILANRISYFYNLHGPSVSVDTACSSSLVCLHLGNQSLRNHESDLSIILGSALHFDPNIFITMTDLGMLSTDGRCRTFDAKGSGYVRGEGICAVILKRFSEAEAHGDTIRAIVRATGANHDGRKQGITLPAPEAQEALIRSTYRSAGIQPADTQYFEAHGTGTAAGDPREAQAIGAVFAENRQQPLIVGSVKSHIGHLEGASGLAAVIKTALALERALIPPNMHFETPNPKIDFEKWKIQVPTRMMDWPSCNGPRRASINSFGYGGTNAHIVLEASDRANAMLAFSLPEMPSICGRPYLIPLTSHSAQAGKKLATGFANYLGQHVNTRPLDLAYTLSTRRSMHLCRSYAIGNSAESLIHGLSNPPPTASWVHASASKPRVGFVFTGQGAQWHAMGRQLIEQSPIFKQTLQRCDSVLQQLPDRPDWSILAELLRSQDTTRLGETKYSQPVCTALQLAIVTLLEAWGIKPIATVGHSSGEIAAAYAAGILSFENAIIAAYYRGLYMSNGSSSHLTVRGAMMAVGLTEAETAIELSTYDGRLAIAAVNSHSSITISGDEDAIIDLKAKLQARKIFARQLHVAQAFHSHHMLPLAAGYQGALESHPDFMALPATCRMFSSVTARVADHRRMGAEYWVANMTGTVRFSDALTGILLDDVDAKNVDVLVEIGPHPALKGPCRQVMASLKTEVPYLPSLTRGTPDYEGLVDTAGQLFAMGYSVDLAAVNSDIWRTADGALSKSFPATRLRDIPSYSWDHSSYWAECRLYRDHRLRRHRHTLLGAPVPGSIAARPRWRNFLRPKEIPWLLDHQIEGRTIFPAAGYIATAIEAVTRIEGASRNVAGILLRDVTIKSALALSEHDAGREVIFELRPATVLAGRGADIWYEFSFFSYHDNGQSQENCHGFISIQCGASSPAISSTTWPELHEIDKRTDRSISAEKYYAALHMLGLQYGPLFRLLSGDVEAGQGLAVARLSFRPADCGQLSADACILHPALLDAAFHPIFAGLESLGGQSLDAPYVPTFLRSMRISGKLVDKAESGSSQQHYRVCSAVKQSSPRVAVAQLQLQSEQSGEILVEMEGLETKALGKADSADGVRRSLFFRLRWQPAFSLLGDGAEVLALDDIADIIDVFAHQYPNSNILHLTSDLDSTKAVLKYLGGRGQMRRRFASLTVHSATVSASLGQMAAEWSGLVKVQEPREGDYDLVIVTAKSEVCVKSLLRPGGYAITSPTQPFMEDMTVMFKTSRLLVWQATADRAGFMGELAIIRSSRVSEQCRAIASILRPHTGPLSEMTIDEVVDDAVQLPKNIVVMAGVGEALFNSPSEQEHHFEFAKKLLTQTDKNIVWVVKGASMDTPRPEQAIVLGLSRSARSENDRLRLVCLDLPHLDDSERVSRRILQALDPTLQEDELVERDGCLFIPRVEADDDLNCKLRNGANRQAQQEPFSQRRSLALKVGKVGDLESLAFADQSSMLETCLGEDELEIEVRASALGVQDVAAAMGAVHRFNLGDECAGIVLRKGSNVGHSFSIGDQVVAWRPGRGAHQRIVRNPAALCFKADDIPLPVAVAFPTALATAYYVLSEVAHLRRGERVLIHSAASDIGQMAIAYAKSVGAYILAVVGLEEEGNTLKSNLGLESNDILLESSPNFVRDVMALSANKGVNVVLHFGGRSLLLESLNCISPLGRFVEIGKHDIGDCLKINAEAFQRNVIFASLDTMSLFEQHHDLAARILQECAGLIHKRIVVPPASILQFSYADAVRAFKSAHAGGNFGKVVLVPREDDLVLVLPPAYLNEPLFSPTKTYLLVGGLGGLGRTLSQWMYRRGARKLAFLSRSGAERPDAKATVQWLQKRDVVVSIHRGDVTDFAAVRRCVQSIQHDLGGVFQAAMVLQDTPLEHMTFTQWSDSVGPKIQGTYNLHKATLDLALDFFVCFSSISGVIGTKAQANYAAANSYQDALMRYRREMGLCGSTMNCGMVVGVGAVAENANLQAIMERLGYDPVTEEELLYQTEEALKAGSSPVVDCRGVEQHQTLTGLNLKKRSFYWCQKAAFRNIYANHDYGGGATASSTSADLGAALRSAANVDDCVLVLAHAFVKKLSEVTGVNANMIQPTHPLSAYGLDSLVAVELRAWFAKAVGVDLALFDVLGAATINALLRKAASLIGRTPASKSADDDAARARKNHAVEPNKPTKQLNSSSLVLGPRPSHVPMSCYQRRLWFMHNFMEDKSLLNLQVITRLKGSPNVALLEATLKELKRRHEILRMAYFEGDDFAEQTTTTHDTDEELELLDFSAENDPESSMAAYASKITRVELEIEDGEVMRAALAKLSGQDYALITIFHHISIDRGSCRSMLSQFIAIYDALRIGQSADAIPLPAVSYVDFTLWHNAHLGSGSLQPHIKFWQEKFRSAPRVGPLLPFAQRDRPAENDFKRCTHRAMLELPLLGRLKRICGQMQTTPFQFLLAAFRAFHYRYTEEKDIVMLMVDGTRPHPEVDDVLGFFTNMIPIRCQTECEVTFESLLRDIKRLTLEAMAHSEVPFDVIVDAVGAAKDPSCSPLGQVAVNYQIHGKMPVVSTGDFDVLDLTTEDVPAACDLSLEALEDPESGLRLRLESSSTLYREDDMARFLDNFVAFLASAIKDHRQPVQEIRMCGATELELQAVMFWNTGYIENAWAGVSVVEKIFQNALASPGAIAVTTSDGDAISYNELVSRAQSVGCALGEAGSMAGDQVGVLARPGIDAIVSALGILVGRCGYVPMDPDFAVERLALMAADSGAKVILVGEGLEALASEIKSKASNSPQLVGITAAALSTGKLELASAGESDPFYTIYTSGSTGIPKGVVLTHGNTHQMLSTLARDYYFCSGDRFLQQSSLSFDLSIVQIFSGLTCGGTVCVASHTIRKDPAQLAKYMQTNRITFTYCTPTQFSLLIDQAPETLRNCRDYRIAFFAGERLPVRVARAFYDLGTPATAYNTWSPSELVVQTTIHRVQYPDASTEIIPIGRPLANCYHYVVDECLNPLPLGLVGEICVGGAQVGAGYINRPKATRRAFVENPFCSADDRARGWTTLFRTGDRGRFLPDGQLEFHGRIAGDKQIKLRGFRIDLSEVEQRIYAESPASGSVVIDCAVVARDTAQGDATFSVDNRQLIAFVIPKERFDTSARKVFVASVHKRLRQHLNEYMLPSGYHFLPSLPVTVGGKTDIRALHTMGVDLVYPVSSEIDTTPQHETKDGELLEAITQVFRDVLKLPPDRRIAPTDSFFELGGQSILLLRLQSQLKRLFKTKLALADLFRVPTPSGVLCVVQRSLQPKTSKISDAKQIETGRIDWEKEATLPNDPRYMPSSGTHHQRSSTASRVLLTGVDSFVGTHMLAELLAGDASTEVFILGTDKPAEHRHVIASFEHYRLFSGGVDNNKKLTPAALVARTRCLPGALSQPRLGLDAHAFRALGEQIHAIYHFGTQVSLLKRYRDLKRVNVDASRDMIELAGVRSAHATHIHCLSTWSVPHLQTWPASRRRRQQQQQQQQHTGQAIEARDGASGTGNSSDSSSTVVAAEVAATHFTPEPTDDFAYVKGRWAAEQLFVQAAARGFAVSIYRASALTASTATRVPEPPCDFVRCLVLSMVRLAVVPLLPTPQAWQRAQAYEQAQGPPSSHSLHAHSPDEFVIDFIPVNYATSVLYKLSRTTRASSNGESATGTGMGTETGTAARFFHITNPQPLPLRRLAGLIGRIRGDGVSAREVAPDEWLRLLQASPSAAFSTSSSPPPASSLLSPLSPLSPSSSSSSLLPTTSAAANAECCVNTATKVNARANANADPDADDADSEANSTMRCSVVRAYIEKQHCMFALDTTRTQRQLRMLRGEGGSGDGDDATTATTTITTTAASAGASASDNVFSCPAVDADFLGRMFFGR